MAPTLRVNPPVLRDVAARERAVAAAVSNTGANEALADTAAGLLGLRSAGGCHAARAALEPANRSVSTALDGHADKLDAAARQYDATDETFGRRLQQSGR
ncbi:hypothetical protein KIH27_11495 [Mycobacterium sp. M1]|uniref:ESX-1 secretion-associated protein n=1 Tax=Mycolicibacter acidiphilus TaxID=2835306 RepID=A0ABS5RIT7_9MYCO|nr:type VII secretion target [Mycolicibacter acidiphilus]MBS9534211.1 hypothetical protein [Mycolicibacter acidiphilus]